MRIYRYLLLLALLTVAVMKLTGCATEKTTRTLEDGTTIESATYGLTPRAGELLDAGIRHRLRMPQPQPYGK